jgi:serine protease Do
MMRSALSLNVGEVNALSSGELLFAVEHCPIIFSDASAQASGALGTPQSVAVRSNEECGMSSDPGTYSNPPYGYAPERHASGRGCSTGLLGMLVILTLVIASPWLSKQIAYHIELGQQLAEVEVARKALANFQGTTEAFRLAAQSVGPSVVHIDTETVVSGRRRVSDDWSRVFPRRLLAGQGSGVIVDKEGYILTNFHVVAEASQLRVRLSDGREITSATIVGADPATDLAVLRIESHDLIAAPWGDSDAMKVGDWVLAVGNPFGLDRTVTQGIISAVGRRGVIGGNIYQDFLQTDAAVNPGNSGGPLINLAGEIVGVNTAIVGEAFQGISFAIPSNMARNVYEEIRKTGSVVRGWLGVAPQDVTADIAEQLGLQGTRGAIVVAIVPNSPAAAAGLEQGDVIMSWDGEPVRDAADLTLRVAGTPIDKKVDVEIVRDGKPVTLKVKVGARPTNIAELRNLD